MLGASVWKPRSDGSNPRQTLRESKSQSLTAIYAIFACSTILYIFFIYYFLYIFLYVFIYNFIYPPIILRDHPWTRFVFLDSSAGPVPSSPKTPICNNMKNVVSFYYEFRRTHHTEGAFIISNSITL